MIKQAFIFLAWIAFVSNGELIMLRNGGDVYCTESTYDNTALTWIPKIKKNEPLHYDENVSWMPASEYAEEFGILSCNLMEEGGGCPILENLAGSWEMVNDASDEYGFILDHRWHSLPLHQTTGNHNEVKQIPLSEKDSICMSILAKNNAFLTVTDGEKGFIIKLDAYVQTGKRQSVSYCPGNNGLQCNDEELKYHRGTKLNNGEEWRNVAINLLRYSSELHIKIDEDVLWQIPLGENITIEDWKHVFISTGNHQIGFWKFHHYPALRLTKPGTEIIFKFRTRENPQLCFSFLYHSEKPESTQTLDDVAAIILMNDVSAPSQIFSEQIKAGFNWQEYRKVLNLNMNNEYQLILRTKTNFPRFAIGGIRVCNEKEHLLARTKVVDREKTPTCALLNSTAKVKLQEIQNQRFIYECQKGSFGENCDIDCSDIGLASCGNLQVCDAQMCSCLPGYHGNGCEQECEGNYGTECQFPCHHCRNGSQCNFMNGSCPNLDCEDGYHPGNDSWCSEKCQQGTYGHNCRQRCSESCKIPGECDHISGVCKDNACNSEDYEPPMCIYPRFMLMKRPEIHKVGEDSIELNISREGISKESMKLISEIAAQYRLHQVDDKRTAWENGTRVTFCANMERITLTGLIPNTTYDVRVILYDERGVGNVGDGVPILPNVTTLAAGSDVTPGHCKASSDIFRTFPIFIPLLCVLSSFVW